MIANYNALHFELGVRNLQGLAANFHRLDETLQDGMRELVRETAYDTRDYAYLIAPKDTHFLADHIEAWFTESGLGFEVGWDANDFYEAGLAFYPWFVEFGTRFMAAQPSVGPAWDNQRPIFQQKMERLMRDAVARIGKR